MKKNTFLFEETSQIETSYLSLPDIPLEGLKKLLPERFLREDLNLPSPGELSVVRHYTNLSKKNFCIDSEFYPLGSCTMKYNPKVAEEVTDAPGFLNLHPYQNESDLQGAMELMYELERILCALTGMHSFTLSPCAGAHGEVTGMLLVSAYHRARRDKRRKKVIVPDSSHGTNPASARMCGYEVVVAESDAHGLLDVDKLQELLDEETAAVMLTNPNTLGLFEERIVDISRLVHDAGGLMYYDGANFNALLGVTTPAQMGFDIVHLNLHKTFATPHGGGGPGSGVVGVTEQLWPFLPVPLIKAKGGTYSFNYDVPHSIGRIRSFYGNFPVLVKAYAYVLRLGSQGLRRVAQHAVLNANYIRQKLKDTYEVASLKPCMHEVVFSCLKQKEKGASAFDIAKRLIDYGIHPPTMYFPLIVKEALMVEPTETECKQTLDAFIEVMERINREIEEDPSVLKSSPHNTPVGRVDEVKAARNPILKWEK